MHLCTPALMDKTLLSTTEIMQSTTTVLIKASCRYNENGEFSSEAAQYLIKKTTNELVYLESQGTVVTNNVDQWWELHSGLWYARKCQQGIVGRNPKLEAMVLNKVYSTKGWHKFLCCCIKYIVIQK